MIVSCNKDKENAQQLLQNSRLALANNDFTQAKAELDSLNNKYPRAFDERKASITLLDTIRLAENSFLRNILTTKKDSLSLIVAEAKTNFKYTKDEKYQDSGVFIPKSLTSSLNGTALESGVYESGEMYLKSIYLGAQKHDVIKATVGDESIETLPIALDGFVHRFNNLGKSYEVIYVQKNYNNGIFSFLAQNADKKIRMELIGKQNYKYDLSQINKKAIAESYKLSQLILLEDSIQTELQKLAYKDFYINNQHNTSIPIEENTED